MEFGHSKSENIAFGCELLAENCPLCTPKSSEKCQCQEGKRAFSRSGAVKTPRRNARSIGVWKPTIFGYQKGTPFRKPAGEDIRAAGGTEKAPDR